MTETTYNGWTNYQTWNVHLWLTNEEGTYRYWTEAAKEYSKWATEEPEHRNEILELADRLQTEHEDAMPQDLKGPFSDLLTQALEEVNWVEIAESLIEE